MKSSETRRSDCGVSQPVSQHSSDSCAPLLTALDLVKRIDTASLRLQVDLFHLQNIAGNITNNLTELMPYTGESAPGREMQSTCPEPKSSLW